MSSIAPILVFVFGVQDEEMRSQAKDKKDEKNWVEKKINQ